MTARSPEAWPPVLVQTELGAAGPVRELPVEDVAGGNICARWPGGAGAVRFSMRSGHGVGAVARWHVERLSLAAIREEERRRFAAGQPLRVAKAHFRHTRKAR